MESNLLPQELWINIFEFCLFKELVAGPFQVSKEWQKMVMAAVVQQFNLKIWPPPHFVAPGNDQPASPHGGFALWEWTSTKKYDMSTSVRVVTRIPELPFPEKKVDTPDPSNAGEEGMELLQKEESRLPPRLAYERALDVCDYFTVEDEAPIELFGRSDGILPRLVAILLLLAYKKDNNVAARNYIGMALDDNDTKNYHDDNHLYFEIPKQHWPLLTFLHGNNMSTIHGTVIGIQWIKEYKLD